MPQGGGFVLVVFAVAAMPARLSSMMEIPYNMGLGLAALGRPGYINLGRNEDLASRSEEAMRARTEDVLDAAYAAGVRWFDCARSYGLAEQFLGDWIRSRGHDVCVTSKWGYRYTADWRIDTGGSPHEVKDHSLAHLRHQAQETIETLGSVDVYQIHSATFESGVLDDEAVLAELARLRSTRNWKVGLSVSSPKQGDVIQAALEREHMGACLFDTVQCTYNVLEQAPFDALVEAHRRGLAVIVKEGMANGRVFQCQPLKDAAKKLGDVPVDALALAAVLAQPFEPYVLSGAVTADQLRSNLMAHDLAARLRQEPEFLETLMRDCRQDSAAYWADRAALAWN